MCQYCFLIEQNEEDKTLKRKQIVALLLSSVIAVSSCLPVGVQAYAAEDANVSAEVESDSALEQNTEADSDSTEVTNAADSGTTADNQGTEQDKTDDGTSADINEGTDGQTGETASTAAEASESEDSIQTDDMTDGNDDQEDDDSADAGEAEIPPGSNGALADSITIMMQKEVAMRFSAQVNSKDYGSLTVFLNYYYSISRLFDVSRNCFEPKPNVDSAVICMDIIKDKKKVNDIELFKNLVRDSFRYKRKTIRNNLKGYDLDIIENVLKKYGFGLDCRAEVLGLDIFIDMCNELCK